MKYGLGLARNNSTQSWLVTIGTALIWLLTACTSGTTASDSIVDTSTDELPTLTSISPTSGSISGGTTVYLYGTYFTSDAEVYFGGVAATDVEVISTTEIEAVTPASTTSTVVSVELIDAGYTSTLSSAFTYGGTTGTPTITSISPTTAPDSGGTYVTVFGSNFSTGMTVAIGSVICSDVTTISASELSCYVGSYATAASGLSIEITNSSGLVGTLADAFTYTASATGTPIITEISPTSGTLSGGTTVIVYGSNFSAGTEVFLGGITCSDVSVVSSSELTCVTGVSSINGTASVVVENASGYSSILASAFTYGSSSLLLSSISPTSGSSEGETLVYLTGSGFTSGMLAYIGGQACTDLSVLSSTELSCYTPAGSGTVSVQLVSANGSSNLLSSAYVYSGGSNGSLYVSLSANGGGNQTLYNNQAVTLSWSSTNAAACQITWADGQATLATGINGSVGVPSLDYVDDDSYEAICTDGEGNYVTQSVQIDRVLYAVGGPDHASYRLRSATDAELCAQNVAAKSKACAEDVRVGGTRVGVNKGGITYDSPSSCACNEGGNYSWY